MKKKFIYSLFSVFIVLASCNDLSNNLQNPNLPLPNAGNLDLVLNTVELGFSGFYWDMSNIGTQLTRQEVMFGPLYKNALNAQSYDQAWGDAYQGVLMNCKTIIDNAPAAKLYTHLGIAHVIRAYTLMTLVDFWGDVPLSKAFAGSAETNPSVDPAKDVYTAALASLDSALLNFNKTASKAPAIESYYPTSASTQTGVDLTKYKALANTLKLKYYMNIANAPGGDKAAAVTAIQTILAGDVIDKADGSEDFQFKYGSTYTNPNSRHPKYNNNYASSGSSDFIGNWFMYVVVAEKTRINGGTSILDPRNRFYFYRQSGDIIDDVPVTALPCATQTAPIWYSNYQYWYNDPNTGTAAAMPFCQLGNVGIAAATGYWGRDHGDNSGIPPDGQLRTTYGVYPAAGLYDDSKFAAISGSGAINLGGQGKGIAPIWQASFTEFLKAEAALNLGVSLASSQSTGIDAATAFAAGVKNSVEKVVAFSSTAGVTVPAARLTTLNGAGNGSKTNYYTWTNSWFAGASAATPGTITPGNKLDVVMREFYIASYGNGIEAYNMYRRTGYPTGMQFLLAHDNTDASDPFIRSAYYPAAAVNRNANITQKSTVDVKVFWDPGLDLQ
jgi:hypothetical protein